MLFRPKVIRNHRSARLGGIAISQPLGVWLLTLAAAGMAVAIVAFLLLGSSRAAPAWRARGQLVPLQGVVMLPAPVTGIVERLDAAEGDAASAGQALASSRPRAPCLKAATAARRWSSKSASRKPACKPRKTLSNSNCASKPTA